MSDHGERPLPKHVAPEARPGAAFSACAALLACIGAVVILPRPAAAFDDGSGLLYRLERRVSLAEVAERLYRGEIGRLAELCAMNDLDADARLMPGKLLKLPALPLKGQDAGAGANLVGKVVRPPSPATRISWAIGLEAEAYFERHQLTSPLLENGQVNLNGAIGGALLGELYLSRTPSAWSGSAEFSAGRASWADQSFYDFSFRPVVSRAIVAEDAPVGFGIGAGLELRLKDYLALSTDGDFDKEARLTMEGFPRIWTSLRTGRAEWVRAIVDIALPLAAFDSATRLASVGLRGSLSWETRSITIFIADFYEQATWNRPYAPLLNDEYSSHRLQIGIVKHINY